MLQRLSYLAPLVFILSAFNASAAAPCYDLLAPIGTLTGCIDLKTYLSGVLVTTIGIAGILAVIMIVICGIRLMTSGSVAGKSEAKECITNALLGLLLAIGSWLILNTINPLLLIGEPSPDITRVALTSAPHVAITEPAPTGSGCYFKYIDIATGDTRYARSSTCPACELLRNNFQGKPATYTVTSSCYDTRVTLTPPPTTAPAPSGVAGSVSCPMTGTNLCEGKYRICANSSCTKVYPGATKSLKQMAEDNAGGNASAVILKAMILQESSCGIQLTGDGGASCGPIQIQPATANKFLSQCAIPATTLVTCGWLQKPANWDKAICLSSKYIQSLTACGSQIQDIAAGYNGGPGACTASGDCGGDTSCSGNPTRKWECLYDDSAHQFCNAGYSNTRNYAMSVKYCALNPGY